MRFFVSQSLSWIVFSALSLALLIGLSSGQAFAADISINLRVEARDDLVTVTVTNTGKDRTTETHLKLELDGRTYRKPVARTLFPGAKESVEFRVQLPEKEGTYPLYTTLYYYNNGQKLSVLDAGYFNFRRNVVLDTPCTLNVIRISNNAELPLTFDKNYRFRLFLPEEIEIQKEVDTVPGRRFILRNTRPDFSSNYAIFAVVQSPEEWAVQSTRICETRLITSKVVERHSIFSDLFILTAGAVGFFLSFLLYAGNILRGFSRVQISVIRYAFSVSVVSALYLGFRKAHLLSELVLPDLYAATPSGWFTKYLWASANILLKRLYFEGGDYDYFFQYVADPLYLYMLTANFLVLFYLIKPDPDTDKYWHLMRTVFSLPPFRWVLAKGAEPKVHWNTLTRLAILTLMVKTFYLPLLSSWSINQGIHSTNLTGNLSLSFFKINVLLVETLIFIDVVIFAFGYLTELPQLKNKIRSVEPTVLGWVVCLMCYPPFNMFAFQLFDQPLHEYWTPTHGITTKYATAMITLLWAIYVWASMALGWKASNLTNRGIVDTGPYRYCRHPAYVSKVGLWMLSSFFMGRYNFFLVLSFAVVYAIRAWTEERHLSRDPDYVAYKKKVRWKMIPWVF